MDRQNDQIIQEKLEGIQETLKRVLWHMFYKDLSDGKLLAELRALGPNHFFKILDFEDYTIKNILNLFNNGEDNRKKLISAYVLLVALENYFKEKQTSLTAKRVDIIRSSLLNLGEAIEDLSSEIGYTIFESYSSPGTIRPQLLKRQSRFLQFVCFALALSFCLLTAMANSAIAIDLLRFSNIHFIAASFILILIFGGVTFVTNTVLAYAATQDIAYKFGVLRGAYFKDLCRDEQGAISKRRIAFGIASLLMALGNGLAFYEIFLLSLNHAMAASYWIHFFLTWGNPAVAPYVIAVAAGITLFCMTLTGLPERLEQGWKMGCKFFEFLKEKLFKDRDDFLENLKESLKKDKILNFIFMVLPAMIIAVFATYGSLMGLLTMLPLSISVVVLVFAMPGCAIFYLSPAYKFLHELIYLVRDFGQVVVNRVCRLLRKDPPYDTSRVQNLWKYKELFYIGVAVFLMLAILMNAIGFASLASNPIFFGMGVIGSMSINVMASKALHILRITQSEDLVMDDYLALMSEEEPAMSWSTFEQYCAEVSFEKYTDQSKNGRGVQLLNSGDNIPSRITQLSESIIQKNKDEENCALRFGNHEHKL